MKGLLALRLWSAATTSAVVAVPSDEGKPVVENERVTVWKVSGEEAIRSLGVVDLDSIEISVGPPAGAVRLRPKGMKGTPTTSQPNGPTVIVDLKDKTVQPLTNASGYPNAVPPATRTPCARG
jgi:hypothetical protein